MLLFCPVNGHTREVERAGALKFVLTQGVLSRLLVFISIFLVAPHIPLPRPEKPDFRPSFSWSQMNLWDGKWYEKIVTTGYEYRPDGREHDITFFPLYPGLIWLVMRTGLGFAAAGTIISNTAFFGALFLLYQRTAEHHGNSAAQWAVAAMSWFPLSVLCSATYSESVFLLLTLAFLQAFEKEHYWLATVLAALVGICRVPGITIVPTVLIVAFFKRLPWRAYLPALSACLALGGFMAFQGFRFHDPLAFVHEQANWSQLTVSNILSKFYLPNNLFRILAGPAAVLLIWAVRGKLCRLDLLYAGFSLAIILYTMRLGSVDRYVSGIGSMFVAAGLWLSQRPRLANVAIAISAAALSFESFAWAWDHFLG
jgi:Gpi18-like mannosyltransferase